MNLLYVFPKRSWFTRCLLAIALLPLAFGAAPRLSNQPIDQLTSVEPNLLFVYDTSGSMKWGHVPDMERSRTLANMTTPPNSVGYRNYECNTLYFDPGVTYTPPPKSSDFTIPANMSYTSAYYDGHRIARASNYNRTTMPFSDYGATIDLSSEFFAWDYYNSDSDYGSVAEDPSVRFYLGNNPSTQTTRVDTATTSYTNSTANPGWTRSGSTGNYTIQIRTPNSTNNNMNVNDVVVVLDPASMAGLYRVSAVVNTGTTRTFSFNVPLPTASVPSAPASWTVFESSPSVNTFTQASDNATWTRSGSTGDHTIIVTTKDTTANGFVVGDKVIVIEPATMAGTYVVTAADNSGASRSFSFKVNLPSASVPTAPSTWEVFEDTALADTARFYRIGTNAYLVADPWFIHNTVLAGPLGIYSGSPSAYNGTYTPNEKNWVNQKDGWIRIPMATTSVNTTITNTRFNAHFTEPPGGGYYYAFTGGGSPISGPYDVRCNEVPATPRGNTTNFTAVALSTLTDADRTQFANWFSYYRIRSTLMKSAVGHSFKNIDSSYRVGFMSINAVKSDLTNSVNDFWVPMAKFDNAQKTSWYSTLYAASDSAGSTPLPPALSAAGQYFANILRKTGTDAASPATYADPMYTTDAGGSCQRNYTLLSTDGIWNSDSTNPLGCSGCTRNLSNVSVGNVDGTSPSAAFAPFVYRSPSPVVDAFNASNTLADVALYYYATDIRPDLANNKKPDNNTPATPFQNMLTYTVGLGLGGRMNFVDTYTTDASPAHDYQKVKENSATCGTLGWGSGSSACNWPDPIASGSGPERVDDLWHAAVNGRGTFFSAKNPQTLSQGFQTALQSIGANTVFATSPANVNPVLSDADNLAYAAYYDSEIWSGRLDAILVDKETGVRLKDGMGAEVAPIWKGHETLVSQAAGTGWDADRRIVVGNTAGVGALPFRWDSLAAGQQTVLKDGLTDDFGQKLLQYIRGERANEAGCSPLATCYGFRSRFDKNGNTHLLGDIVNAIPVVVAKPNELYGDTDNPGYSNFVTAKSSRTPIVYVVANDGMVHAFNASSTGTGATRAALPASGREEWAYIPNILLRSTTDEDSNKNGLPSFAYNGSTTPTFHKHFFIDSNPFSADVNFSRTDTTTGGVGGGSGTGTDWRTILVGGLGKGGKGYYALDVTYGDVASDGTSGLTEANVANKVLWEFVGDSDMGFSYAEPFATRHPTYGWVVVVSSGYNNATGNGAVWVLNAKSGQVIRKFSIQPSGCEVADKNCFNLDISPVISLTDPLNLGPVTGYVESAASEKILALYAGDMRGNLWRMDVSNADKANWTIHRVATLTSSGNGVYGSKEQPITAIPAITYDPKQDRRWVFVGTGIDLSRDDRDSAKDQAKQQQTMYGIIDGSGSTALPNSSLPVTRSSLVSVDLNTTDAVANVTGKNGFYIDMAATDTASGVLAERIVFEPLAAFGVVAWATRIPTNDVCSPGFTGRLYIRSYAEGEIGTSRVAGATAGSKIAFKTTKGPAPRIVILQTSNATTGATNKVIRVCDIEGKCETFDLNELPPTSRTRVGWRELFTEE